MQVCSSMGASTLTSWLSFLNIVQERESITELWSNLQDWFDNLNQKSELFFFFFLKSVLACSLKESQLNLSLTPLFRGFGMIWCRSLKYMTVEENKQPTNRGQGELMNTNTVKKE